MKNIRTYAAELSEGVKTVLKTRRGKIETVLISLVILLLLFMVPVWTTPGNDLLFQISITTADVMAIMVLLSAANGLLIAMQLYIHRNTKEQKVKQAASQGAAILSAVFGALTSTVACAACFSLVFSFLGLGTAVFLVENRGWIALAALTITLIAGYFAAKRINNNCAACTVNPNRL